MAEYTTVDFLLEFWTLAANPETNRYDLLKAAIRCGDSNERITGAHLKYARRNFDRHPERYPLSDKCWICGDVWSKVKTQDRYLVRHHILPLSKRGWEVRKTRSYRGGWRLCTGLYTFHAA